MAIKTKNLQSGYGREIIIDNVSLSIPRGSICSLIGPNGCGKSTFLKTLSGSHPRIGGEILIGDRDIANIDTKSLARKLAFLVQNPYIPDQFSVRELVSHGRYPHTNWMGSLSAEDIRIINRSMKLTGIEDYANREIAHLSGGEQQRAWLAMALAQGTEIMLLDEPTTHLDISHQFQTLELIKKLNTDLEHTILMVLHDLNQAARYSDIIFVMKNGKIAAEGSPKEIITKELLKDVFDLETRVIHDTEYNCPYFIPLKSIEKGYE